MTNHRSNNTSQSTNMHWTENKELINHLKSGDVVIMPSDTIYGISTNALNQSSIERIFELKQRKDSDKSVITLCASIEQIKQFDIAPELIDVAKRFWPGPVSVVFPSDDSRYEHLRRGKPGISFRIPADPAIRALIKKTGPIVSTSANLLNMPPALDIPTAKRYFGDKVEMYIDDGPVANPQPSSVIAIQADGSYNILRRGRGLGDR